MKQYLLNRSWIDDRILY